jgi:hypothetical protein
MKGCGLGIIVSFHFYVVKNQLRLDYLLLLYQKSVMRDSSAQQSTVLNMKK